MIFYQIAYTMAYKLDEKLVELKTLADKVKEVIELNEEKIKKLALLAIVAFALSLPLRVYDSVVYSGFLLYMLSLCERKLVG